MSHDIGVLWPNIYGAGVLNGELELGIALTKLSGGWKSTGMLAVRHREVRR